MTWLTIGLALVGAVAALWGGYLGFLAVFARPVRPAPRAGDDLRFDVVVPAHDEATGIGATVDSLRALDWPGDRFRIVVVADNCTDDTAAVARRHGAMVWERRDAERRGKGFALGHAFRKVLTDGFADAVVVVDADTVVDPALLQAFAARLDRGAWALQAHYAVRNVEDSWRTRLMELAFTLFHGVRSLARERLDLSAGLRGNGMCFSRAALEAAPYAAHSVVEDVEYGLDLALIGIRVEYVPEVRVLGEMPERGADATSQRRRWEEGRRRLRRHYLGRLIRRGLLRRDPMLLDLAMDLAVPPLAQVGGVVFLGLAATVLLGALGAYVLWPAALFGVAALGLGAYLVRGLGLSGLGWRGVAALAAAPAYLAWKVALLPLRWRRRHPSWTRTVRKGEAR